MRGLAAGLIALAMGGCATVPGGGSMHTPSGGSALEAHLLPASAGSWGYAFDLSDEAYVAVFRISPRSGATLVYPRGSDGMIDRVNNRGLTHIPGRLTRFAGSRAASVIPSNSAQPDFYMLIASETPLDLNAVGPFGDGLRFALGAGGARFQSPYTSMERLVSLVVPDPSQNNWTTDYYVDWPEVLHTRPGSGLVRVACGDVQVYVPTQVVDEAIRTLCIDQTKEVDLPAPQDSAVSAKPIRREPPSLDDRITSRQLETPRQWESSMRQAGISHRAFGDAGGDYERVDRSNRLRRSGNGAGVNSRAGADAGTRAVGRPEIDRSGTSSPSSGRAEPSRGGASSGGADSGSRPSSNSNPAINGNS